MQRMEPSMTKQKKTIAKATHPGTKVRKQRAEAAAAPKTKLGRLEGMLRRTEGATIAQIAKALDWQLHSVRGAISGSLKKKQGLTVVAEKAADGERVYRIAG
jgi:Protein of unknown function (DUF3489)